MDKPLYPQRVTIWCGFWAGGIIGPYFFENEAGAAVSVNGLHYRTMINKYTEVAKPSVFFVKSFQAE